LITIKDILKDVTYLQIVGDENTAISEITFDSRKLEKGSLFIAFKGTQFDGHKYIDAAIEKGAIAVLCEKLPENKVDSIVYILVENSHLSLAKIASNFYGRPSEEITLIGVTRTNGKTTIATLLYELFNSL